MKNLLLLASIVTIALAGCSKNEAVNELGSNNNVIKFNTYGTVTKGTPMNGTASFNTTGNDFGVTGYLTQTTSAYLGKASEGTQIKYDGTMWDYVNDEDVRYWPINLSALNFYAYAPFTYQSATNPMTNLNISESGMTFNYTVTDVEQEQSDLMFASALNISKQSDNGKVLLLFKHALTQVYFTAKTTSENLCVDIAENGIQIANINSSAAFSLPTSESDNGWSNISVPTTYTVTSAVMTAITNKVDDNVDFTTIGSADATLMLIPQQFAAASDKNANDGAYLNIKCKIYQKLEDGTPIYLFGSESAYDDYFVPFTSKDANGNELWNRGKRVVYNLIFAGGPDNLRIDFDPTVEDWSSATSLNINIE